MAVEEKINQSVTKYYELYYMQKKGGEDLYAEVYVSIDEVKKEIQYYFDEDLLKRIPQPFPIVPGMSAYMTALANCFTQALAAIIAKLTKWELPEE